MLIPIRWPEGNFNVDPEGWARMQADIQKRKKHYSKMYDIDRNEYTYVYGLVIDGEVAYIGISKTPFRRYMNHLNEKFDGGCEVYLTLLGKGSREEMLLVERKLIEKMRPDLNKQYVIPTSGRKKKYVNLGPTERIRIPEKPKAHIENILEKFDKLYGMNPDDKIREEFEKLMIMYEKALDGLIKKGLDNP